MAVMRQRRCCGYGACDIAVVTQSADAIATSADTQRLILIFHAKRQPSLFIECLSMSALLHVSRASQRQMLRYAEASCFRPGGE